MKLPIRNNSGNAMRQAMERRGVIKISDEELEKKQVADCDANVEVCQALEKAENPHAPAGDAVALAEMGLSPAIKKEHSVIPTRAESVQQLLSAATLKASTLKLTKEEREALRSDFPDSDFQRGAGGDTNLIYLEHCALRNRLSDVIGLGEWSFEIIRSWTENFEAGNPPKPGVRVYVEGMLLIRGAKVGLAIGDGSYFKHNAKGNFGDAYESAKTAAFRRTAKDFGIGLQAFSKDWCEQWKKKYTGFNRPERGNP